MKVSNLRAGGTGVPQIFEVTSHHRGFLLCFAEAHVFSHYNTDVHDWPVIEQMMDEIADAVSRACGQDEVERLIDDYANDLGLERV